MLEYNIIVYSIIAIFIAWIWIDYFRLIDIYEAEKLKYIILTFILGAASVFIVNFIDKVVLKDVQFELEGTFINDFLYCVFKIGCVEEFAKIIPFVIIFFLIRKQINEPIDYIVYISVSALGFSAAENILYFQRHGAAIISGRAILSTVGHMFNTSLFAYGFIRYRFYDQKKNFFMVLVFFFLAALSHGFYDFWLLYEDTKSGGWLITVVYFLITISIFATIMNNALNNSSFFTYKKVIASNKVARRMLLYYCIVFLLQFVLVLHEYGLSYMYLIFRATTVITAFVVVVAVVRLSRFKLIQGRWQRIKIELPFSFYTGSLIWGNETNSGFRLRIKGESYDEVYINTYYEEYFLLNPLSKTTYLKNPQLAFIEKKLFLKNDETFYLTRIFSDEQKEHSELVLIKPKMSKKNMIEGKYPVVAILKFENLSDIENLDRDVKGFKFQEWAFAKPHTDHEHS
jgi:RsiW-degrading membrane proteinase PrsW (M82 family)